MLLHATRCPTAVIGEIHDNAFYMYTRPFRHAPAHGTRPLPVPPLPPLAYTVITRSPSGGVWFAACELV